MSTKAIQILHRFTLAVIFEAAVDTVKDAVLLAISQGVNLTRANLTRANLYGANLTRANLDGANLDGANLDGANLPSPTAVLLAAWGTVSDQLCADLMLWDSANHPDPTMFDKWALNGPCPYADVKVGRAANFKEQRELWGKGVSTLPYQLMLRVLAEKCPVWTEEEKASFDLTIRK